MRSLDHEFVFIHGRKAGGRSIKAALAPLCDSDDYLQSGVLTGRYIAHGQPEGQGHWDREAHQGLAIIANVRNPFGRVVSAWRWAGLGQRSHGRRMGFDEFVDRLPRLEDGFGDWIHATAPYATMLLDDRGPIWTHLIRLETIEDDFARVVTELDLPISSAIGRDGGSRASLRAALRRRARGSVTPVDVVRSVREPRGHRPFYTRHSRAVVERAFAADLEQFDYEF